MKAARSAFYENMSAETFNEYLIALNSGAEQRSMDLKGFILSEPDAKMLAGQIRSNADPFGFTKILADSAGAKLNEVMKQIVPKMPVVYQIALSGRLCYTFK